MPGNSQAKPRRGFHTFWFWPLNPNVFLPCSTPAEGRLGAVVIGSNNVAGQTATHGWSGVDVGQIHVARLPVGNPEVTDVLPAHSPG